MRTAAHPEKYQIRFSPLVLAKLNKLAETRGITKAEVIRDLILTEYDKNKKEQHEHRNS